MENPWDRWEKEQQSDKIGMKFQEGTFQLAVPRVLLAATASGGGKTTVICGLLEALKRRNCRPAAFKCGPDYIDPMFHGRVMGDGCHSRNLDSYFMDQNTLNFLLWKNSKGCDLALIEGVMGYYDGLAGTSTEASTYDLARLTDTPVLLLMDGKGASLSLAAQMKGFLDFRRDNHIKGVLINRMSPAMLPRMREVLLRETGIPLYGCIPNLPECNLESRHLGLVTAMEVEDFQQRIGRIAEQLKESVDLDGILNLAKQASPLKFRGCDLFAQLSESSSREKEEPVVRIGIAKDEAFQFYYQDSLELLVHFGGELVPFSPLHDKELPLDLDGLLLGGGYPELSLELLSRNRSMARNIRSAILAGMPCLAECGGFMYLHDHIVSGEGKSFPMVGVLKGTCRPKEHLVRFGYAEFTALEDTMLCKKGDRIRGHEFHYWDSDDNGDQFLACKPLSERNWKCMHNRKNLLAGFPHLHFYGNPSFARSFIEACNGYRKARKSH